MIMPSGDSAGTLTIGSPWMAAMLANRGVLKTLADETWTRHLPWFGIKFPKEPALQFRSEIKLLIMARMMMRVNRHFILI